MKKKIALLLACLMLGTATLTSCIDEPEQEAYEKEDGKSEETTAELDETTAEADETTAELDETTAEADDTTAEVEDTADTEPADDPEKSIFGVVEDGHYVNEFLGFEFVPGDELTIKDAGDTFDLFAEDDAQESGVFVMLVNVPGIDAFAENALVGLMLEIILSSSEGGLVYGDMNRVEFAGREYISVEYSEPSLGACGMMLIGAVDEYLIAVDATAYDAETIDKYFSYFSEEIVVLEEYVYEGTAADEPAAYIPGTVSENYYYSEYLGLEFVPTPDMTMLSEEEIYAAMGIGADVMGIDKSKIDWEAFDSIYEMQAGIPERGSNVIVASQKLVYSGFTEKQYLELIVAQSSNISTDATITAKEYGTAVIAGQEYSSVEVTTEVAGLQIVQIIYLRKTDSRLVSIILSMLDRSDAEKFLACFREK